MEESKKASYLEKLMSKLLDLDKKIDDLKKGIHNATSKFK